MSSITVDFPEEKLLRLREAAARLGVTAEELVRVSVEDLLARPEEDFTKAAEYVLRKNAELYRRLA